MSRLIRCVVLAVVWIALVSSPRVAVANDSSGWSVARWYHTKWQNGFGLKPMVQFGPRMTHSKWSPYALGTSLLGELQANLWFDRIVGLYAFGGTSFWKTKSSEYGVGVKIPFFSAPFGAHDRFLGGLVIYVAADVAQLESKPLHKVPSDFNSKPRVFRLGGGFNMGMGPWGTYTDFSFMCYSSQGRFYFAPLAAVGYAF